MKRLAIVMVYYRTPALVEPALAALRRDAAGSALDLELLLVDNGSEAEDRRAWNEAGIRTIGDGTNRGYAGGVNAGVAATSSPCVVAMNPDVAVREGCLERLTLALEQGNDAAGPLFEWDLGGRVMLPPTEVRTLGAELLTALATRWKLLSGVARRRWRRHARRHWCATADIESSTLSGALLAFRRDSWNRIGPFDDGYRLYFEESDWLERLRRAGGRSRFVPTARAFHAFAQSSFREPSASGWFTDAERRFRERWYGAVAARVLDRLARFGPPARRLPEGSAELKEPLPISGEALGVRSGPAWVEISPLERGFPAASERLPQGTDRWSLPEEIRHRPGTPSLRIRGLDARDRESTVFAIGAAPGSSRA